MNIDENNPRYFMIMATFMTMIQAALSCRSQGYDKKFFLDFASETWEAMLLSSEKELKEKMNEIMLLQWKP